MALARKGRLVCACSDLLSYNIAQIVKKFYHIFDVQGFFAEKLDLLGSDPDAIMQEALQNVDIYFA